MDKISVMISSVGKGLEAERDAISRVFIANEFIELKGVAPYNDSSYSSSSSLETIEIARKCTLYILILSNTFGFTLPDGKSATEVEFDAAFKADPTKILVFKKDEDGEPDKEQGLFIKRVCDYYSGYWRSTFRYSHELQELVKRSFQTWLNNRASLGEDLNYLDHFLRIAKQIKPEATSQVYYSLTKDLVELTYSFWDKTHSIQFTAKDINRNFWGCISELQICQREWVK